MLVSKTDTTMSLSKLTSFITFFTASSNSLVLFNTWNTNVTKHLGSTTANTVTLRCGRTLFIYYLFI